MKEEKYSKLSKEELAKVVAKNELYHQKRIVNLEAWRKELCMRIYGVDEAKNTHPKDILRKILLEGLQFNQQEMEDVLVTITRIRKIDSKTCLLVEFSTLDIKQSVGIRKILLIFIIHLRKNRFH